MEIEHGNFLIRAYEQGSGCWEAVARHTGGRLINFVNHGTPPMPTLTQQNFPTAEAAIEAMKRMIDAALAGGWSP
jgi:hypothetical protein